MSRGRAVTNQQAYEMYRRKTESALARKSPPMAEGEAWTRHAHVAAGWLARYSRRHDAIQPAESDGQGLADTLAAQALLARNLAKDVEFPQIPVWDKMTSYVIETSLKGNSPVMRLDVLSPSDPCRFGPSLRRLWGEAKARGLTDEEAWGAIDDWANHRPVAWKNDDETKRRKPSPHDSEQSSRLESTTTWVKTDNIDYPWTTKHQSENWQVRINDFPDEHMYTLFVNGESVGDFDDWPIAWDRGDRPKVEMAPKAPAVIAVKGRFVERYLAGEHEAVWAELVYLGPAVRNSQYLPEATSVARETMRRARQNVEMIITRLDEMGYHFWEDGRRSSGKVRNHIKDPDVFMPPSRGEKGKLDKWERENGPLPLSLRMWLEEVGRVDLTGSHPALAFLEYEDNFPGIYADPLMVTPNADSLEEMLGLGDSENDMFVSFDNHDKAGLGTDRQLDSIYSIEVPNPAADGSLKGYTSEITFVEYLRLSFRWGGFPGWKDHQRRPERELAVLIDGLLPL